MLELHLQGPLPQQLAPPARVHLPPRAIPSQRRFKQAHLRAQACYYHCPATRQTTWHHPTSDDDAPPVVRQPPPGAETSFGPVGACATGLKNAAPRVAS